METKEQRERRQSNDAFWFLWGLGMYFSIVAAIGIAAIHH